MNELPARAQQLIRAAKAAHDPPAGALVRARERLDAAIAAERGNKIDAGPARRPWWRAAKISLASVVIGLVGLGALYVGSRVPPKKTSDYALSAGNSATSAPNSAMSAQDVAPAPQPTEPARALVPEAPRPRAPSQHVSVTDTAVPLEPAQASPTHVSRHAPDLESEMRILTAAAEAVEHNDFSRAHALLRAHRGRFGAGQLRQERVGLEILIQCLNHSPTAGKRARAYLQNAPYALLSARIQAACSID